MAMLKFIMLILLLITRCEEPTHTNQKLQNIKVFDNNKEYNVKTIVSTLDVGNEISYIHLFSSCNE